MVTPISEVTYVRSAPQIAPPSQVEFSKREPVFSMRFLVVGVPFHSQYLRDAVDEVIYQIRTSVMRPMRSFGLRKCSNSDLPHREWWVE
jgi:hypothetical protein